MFVCERESLRTLAVREIKYKREDAEEESNFGGGGGNVQMASVILHCRLDFPVPSTSCHIDKCLGVLWNEGASFHCFLSVNITEPLSEVILSVSFSS